MQYEILYGNAFSALECELERGESVKAESDAMVSMSGTLDIEGSMDGNVLGGLARKFLAGEKFFFQTIRASRGAGKVLLAPSSLGGIIDVALDGSYHLRVQKNGFLAATSGINVNTTMQNLMQGFFSRARDGVPKQFRRDSRHQPVRRGAGRGRQRTPCRVA